MYIYKNIIIPMLLFLVFNYIHKVFFVNSYSSIALYDFNSNEDYDLSKRTSSFFMRILFPFLIVVFTSKFIEYHFIYLGFFIASFLIIWPPITYFKLLNFPFTTQKIVILFRYLLYIMNPMFVVYFFQNFFNDSLLENPIFSIIKSLIFLAFPTFLDKLISYIYYISPDLSTDTFKEEVLINVNNVITIKHYFWKRYRYEIDKIAKKNNINPCLILYIICYEHLYRGNYRYLEKMLCFFFYEKAIEMDVSIGLGQLKISTISEFLEKSPIKFRKRIFHPNFQINIIALIIKKSIDKYEEEDSQEDIYSHIISDYNGIYENKNVKVYSATIRSLMNGKEIQYKECKNNF